MRGLRWADVALADLELGSVGPCLAAWIGAMSLVAAAAMAWDKRQAGRGGRRVSHRTLLGLAFLGGGPGAVAAAHVLRHKTRSPRVLLPLWVAAVAWTGLLVAVAAPALAGLLATLGRP